MSNTSITYVVAGLAGVLSLALWGVWILWPAVSAYSRLWERFVAGFLSLYVLAAFLVAGAGAGAAVLWYYDRV
jgi:hypothetical protein